MRTQTKQRPRTGAQIAAEGFSALVERLGVADAIRFVQIYHHGEGDYTRKRHEWLGRLGKDDVRQLMLRTNKQLSKRKRK
jgi:hypothetical protein